MMWRCNFLVFWFLFFAVSLDAQRAPDSVFFVKYAATLDLLLQPGYEAINYESYARDSVSFMQHGAGKMLTVYETTTDFTGKNPDVTKGFSKYIFRSDGQISSSGDWSSDSALLMREDYVYLRTGQVSRIIKSYSNPVKYDTTQLTYDRAGQLVAYCEKGECIQRLYNSKRQLIVKKNALYGFIRGDYTYAYDNEGRLVQRRFLEARSGVVLCTDTIQYSFGNEEKTLITEKHFLRIGNGEWIPIDEMLAEAVQHKVLRYDLFYYVMRSSRGVSAPGYIAYTYDREGNLLQKERKDKSGEERTSYHRTVGADTIRSTQMMQSTRAKVYLLSYERIITYDSKGVIVSVQSTGYTIKKHFRYWKSQVANIREEKYQWN